MVTPIMKKKKREIIKNICQYTHSDIVINKEAMNIFLESVQPFLPEPLNLGGDITRDEVQSAILQLNTGGAPGPDGLPVEVYREGSSIFCDLLTDVFNEGLKTGMLHNSMYEGVISLIYKKGDPTLLENWRHITVMNVDYKILAKIIMNRLNNILISFIEREQTCAIKGRYMWDNLGVLRDIIEINDGTEGFFVISLDQKKAFDLISRDYLWEVLRRYGFSTAFINIVKLLYFKSSVQVNVNGVLTDQFEISRGVKQGCPLSAALYILAINPLLSRIKNDNRLAGIRCSNGNRVVVLAYADDIVILVKNQQELDIVRQYFNLYEAASGAKLNNDKTEGIWVGKPEIHPAIDIHIKEELKVLGVYFSAVESYNKNWERKEIEIKNELNKWEKRACSYKTKISIIKTCVLSRLCFLSSIYPPNEITLKRLQTGHELSLGHHP